MEKLVPITLPIVPKAPKASSQSRDSSDSDDNEDFGADSAEDETAIPMRKTASCAPTPNQLSVSPQRGLRQRRGSALPSFCGEKSKDLVAAARRASQLAPQRRFSRRVSTLPHMNQESPSRPGSAVPVDSKSPRPSPRPRLSTKLDNGLQALVEHAFFEGLKMGTIISLAKVAVQKTEEDIIKASTVGGKPDVIMAEGEANWASDSLWIIVAGCCEVEQNGEKLGKLSAGDEFGSAVAFELLESQPFTVKLCRQEFARPEDKLACWCLPNTAVLSALRQFPEAKLLLEERVMDNVRRQLSTRLSKLLFFQHCSPAFMESIVPKLKMSFHEKGTVIAQGDEKADSMLIVLSGSVRLGRVIKVKFAVSEARRKRPTLKGDGSPKNSSSPRGHHRSGDEDEDKDELPTPSWASRLAQRTSLGPRSARMPRWVARSSQSSSERSSVKDGSAAPNWPATPHTPTVSEKVEDVSSPTASSFLNRFRSTLSESSVVRVGSSIWQEKNNEIGPEANKNVITENEAAAVLDGRHSDSEHSSTESSDSGSSSDDGEFLPAKNLERVPIKLMIAGPSPICFGEGILLGFQEYRSRPVVAGSGCIVVALQVADFQEQEWRHPVEAARFSQMEASRYQEWKRSDIARLASVDLFSKCSDAFLAAIIQSAVMQVFFEGEDIIAEGMIPRGLLLLMSGKALQISNEGGEETEIESPHSFGTMEWLGVCCKTEWRNLKARQVCLVFNLSHDHLLDALKDHPRESTIMAQQVLKKQGIRMSINSGLEHLCLGEFAMASSTDQAGKQQRTWHKPFVRGLDKQFVTMLAEELKVCKLVPGQVIFSAPHEKAKEHNKSAPVTNNSHQRGGHTDDADFLVVLIHGTAQVDETPHHKTASELQTWKQVQAPLVIVGFNRRHRAMVVASTVCEVHRFTMPACSRVAAAYPEEMRKFLKRMHFFTQKHEAKSNTSWWPATKTLRHQAWFRDSDEAFLQELLKILRAELYLPDEVLVSDGDVADSTLLLECGSASVEKIDAKTLGVTELAKVHDGYWTGEMAMFAGESKRKATVKATTVCKVQRLYNKELVRLLSLFPTEHQRFRLLAEHRLRAEKGQLQDHAFFKEFDRPFLNLLRQKCRAQVFFPNEVLMKQGDIADSLFILGQESLVTMHVDGCQVKKLSGLACLGTKALLSPRPVKRASTVITQTVCAVRTLTREDWLDALKLHPEHQKWLGSFTRDQMGKVSEARSTFQKKRALEKIHLREMAATALHCDRLVDPELYVHARRKHHSWRLAGLSKQSQISASVPIEGDTSDVEDEINIRVPTKVAQALPETWECFNGSQVTVPHTRCPQLGQTNDDMEVLGEHGGEIRQLKGSDSCDSLDYDACQEALENATQR